MNGKALNIGEGNLQSIKKGMLQDSWVLASMAGLAERPKLFSQVVKTKDKYVPDSGILKY